MDRIEFDELVREYKDKVYNTCLGFVKNHEDAQDLAQDVFIEVYRKSDKFREDSSWSTWLYRIAVNKSLEHIRKFNRKKRKGMQQSVELASIIGGSSFYHPGVTLENKERSAILFAAIELLPDQQKVAFTLQKLEDLSLEEIGKVMDKSIGSIESLLQRAKVNLRKTLKDYYEK